MTYYASLDSAESLVILPCLDLALQLVVLAEVEQTVSDRIAVLVLQGQQSEYPQQELDDIDGQEGLQQFLGCDVVVAGGVAVLEVDCDCYYFIDEHQQEVDCPETHHYLLGASRDSLPGCNCVGQQGDQADDQAKCANCSHLGPELLGPRESEEQEDPCQISRAVGEALHPVKGGEEYEERDDHNDDDFGHCELEEYFIIGTDVVLAEPCEGNNQHDACEDEIDGEEDVERDFAELFLAAHVEDGDQVGGQHDVVDHDDEFEEGVVADGIVQLGNVEGDDSRDCQLDETQEDVEGSALRFADIHLHHYKQIQSTCNQTTFLRIALIALICHYDRNMYKYKGSSRMEFNIIVGQQAMAKSRTKSKQPKVKKAASKSKQISKPKSDSPQQSTVQSKPKRRPTKEEIKEVKQSIAHDYTIGFEEGVCKIKMHQNYEIREDHELYKNINNLFLLFKQKEEQRCLKTHRIIPYSNFPVFEFKLQGEQPKDTKCSICQFEFQDIADYEAELVKQSDEDVIILPCSHLIHRSCFNMLKGKNDWVKCPVCSSIYGVMIGDQPPGKMTWQVQPMFHCDGFPDMGTIVIDYSMNSGKRGDISFHGTHRTAYLPDNAEGNQVLKLLAEAFNRKLIFTVGRSVTTGRDNQVVWNGIHHKTNLTGGSAYFGYPDETYFKRVRLQLAAKGIY